MLKELSSLFSFLTIIPGSHSDLGTIAKYMYIFPLVGIAIGLLIGSMGLGLSYFLEPLIVALLVTAGYAILTGIHHTDGLADFADGLMTKGSKEKKLDAMKDVSVGSAGIFSIVLYIVAIIISLSMMRGFELFYAILLSEIVSKFSMVMMASLGISAKQGSNTPFVSVMKDKKKLLAAFAITAIPLIVLGGQTGLVVFAVGITIAMILLTISQRSFGGITGDVMGAGNELTRISSLLIFASAAL